MMKVMAPAHMKIKAGSRAMLVSLLKLLNVSFSDQAQIPMARIPKPRSWIQMRHEKLSRSIYKVTHPKDDVESEDDIFEATGHLTGVPDPPPPLLVLRVGARRHLRTPIPPEPLAIPHFVYLCKISCGRYKTTSAPSSMPCFRFSSMIENTKGPQRGRISQISQTDCLFTSRPELS